MGYPRISWDILGCPRISEDIPRYLRISQDLLGYPGISLDIPGYAGIYPGIPWDGLGYPQISQDSLSRRDSHSPIFYGNSDSSQSTHFSKVLCKEDVKVARAMLGHPTVML